MRFDKKGRPIADPTCPYQPGGGVLCNLDLETPERCQTCGWNPKVAAKRKATIRAAMGFDEEVAHE